MFPEFSLSKNYVQHYPGVGFGLTLISGCKDVENPPEFKAYKKKHLRKMRRRETLVQITRRIDTYADFFQSFGYPCPLVKHLKRTVDSGFPKYALFVDAHFMAEMCAGILVAVTDFDRFDGRLTLDVARKGEICVGMGNRDFVLKENEIVLRDEKDIVCVLCQGADEKTRVNETTTHVLFYAYAVPGIDSAYLQEGLSLAAETVVAFGGGIIEGIEIHQQ
jgi:DNA/RNA-binding domain of Phe-tRNA-synthetase-like protein